MEMTFSTITEDKRKSISVFGSGDYGRAIAGKIAQSGYKVYIGSRDPGNKSIIKLLESKPGTELVTQDEAIMNSDIIIIAINSDHYLNLPKEKLKGKTLIDVANITKLKKEDTESEAEILQRLLPDSFVVKAFNVLSAYALENNVQQNAKQVPVASNHKIPRDTIISLVGELGYTPVDKGSLKAAREIEAIPVQLLPSWQLPFKIVLIMWIIHYIILFLKFQICNIVNNESSGVTSLKHLFLLNFNRTTAITALWTLTLCYLPGVFAAYIQLIRGTKYKRFPNWLDTWLKMRKQLGLIMLMLAVLHTVLGAAIWSGSYNAFIWDKSTKILTEVFINPNATQKKLIEIPSTTMSWQGEIFLTMGTLSMILTSILGVSSLPSVSMHLTWREFTFIQSKLGWMALLTATLHDGLLGWGFESSHYTVCSLPSGAQYAFHLPLVTIFLKIILLIPCIDNHLQKIRRGHNRVNSKSKINFVQPIVKIEKNNN